MMSIARRVVAEVLGTFWLVLGGCGSAVLAAAFPSLGIGFVGVSLAFGLTVLTMAYTIGPVSGCHLNPAVTVGLMVAGRFPGRDVLPYILAQILGSVLGAGVLWMIASGAPGFDLDHSSFATNGYGEHSLGHYSLWAAFVCEAVLSGGFVFVILAATSSASRAQFAPIAIGLCLTLIHLISIPVTNTSVNPARSTGPALFVGGGAMEQLWLFWVAPLVGAFVVGFLYPVFEFEDDASDEAVDVLG